MIFRRTFYCRCSRAVKWDGLKIHWLSAFAGSNPVTCILTFPKSDVKITLEILLGLIRRFPSSKILPF